jgi:alpha-beta hydrolase superfamily lysophospholipase
VALARLASHPAAPFAISRIYSNDYWSAGKAYYDPAKITVPALLVQAEWDRDLPPYMAQTLFPLLVSSPGKRYVMLPEGTHTIIMEKNRRMLFEAVQAFLDEAGRS